MNIKEFDRLVNEMMTIDEFKNAWDSLVCSHSLLYMQADLSGPNRALKIYFVLKLQALNEKCMNNVLNKYVSLTPCRYPCIIFHSV